MDPTSLIDCTTTLVYCLTTTSSKHKKFMRCSNLNWRHRCSFSESVNLQWRTCRLNKSYLRLLLLVMSIWQQVVEWIIPKNIDSIWNIRKNRFHLISIFLCSCEKRILIFLTIKIKEFLLIIYYYIFIYNFIF